MKLILDIFEVSSDKTFSIFSSYRERAESKKMRMEKLAINASIPEQVVGNLFNMLEKEGTAEQLGKHVFLQ